MVDEASEGGGGASLLKRACQAVGRTTRSQRPCQEVGTELGAEIPIIDLLKETPDMSIEDRNGLRMLYGL